MRTLALLACLLTICITGASAFIRHTQAGVGCEGWPECRERGREQAAVAGAGTHPEAPDELPGARATGAAGLMADPGNSRAIAAARMLHRASASVVGLLAIGLAVFGWDGASRSGRFAAVLALLVSASLAWLGRYTPNPLPWVTIGNVAGGFVLAAAFAWAAAERPPGKRRLTFVAHRETPHAAALRGNVAAPDGGRLIRSSAMLRRSGIVRGSEIVRGSGILRGSAMRRAGGFVVAGWVLLVALVWLGVLIGARDAIPLCPEALCFDGARLEPAAFDPGAQTGGSRAGGQALHLAHRLVALLFVLVVSQLAWRFAHAGQGLLATLLVALLAVQVALGLATASGTLPLASATLHNVVAALWAALLAGVARGVCRSSGDEAGPD